MVPFAPAVWRAWRALNCDQCSQRWQGCMVEMALVRAQVVQEAPGPEAWVRCGGARFATAVELWPCLQFRGEDGSGWDIETFAYQLETRQRHSNVTVLPTRRLRPPQWLCASCVPLVRGVACRLIDQYRAGGHVQAVDAVADLVGLVCQSSEGDEVRRSS